MVKVKEKLVEIEFLGVVKDDGKRIESFTELGHKYGVGTKISVPVYRAASLIKTYPEGFRYTDGSSDAGTSRADGGGSSESGDEPESGSEDPDPDDSALTQEPMKPKKPKKAKRPNFFKRKAKKAKKDKSMKGRQNKSL